MFDASAPDGVYVACESVVMKYPYGDPCEAICQSSVGFFVDIAFGCHEPQSGSSATFELMPIAWRFFVMI